MGDEQFCPLLLFYLVFWLCFSRHLYIYRLLFLCILKNSGYLKCLSKLLIDFSWWGELKNVSCLILLLRFVLSIYSSFIFFTRWWYILIHLNVCLMRTSNDTCGVIVYFTCLESVLLFLLACGVLLFYLFILFSF